MPKRASSCTNLVPSPLTYPRVSVWTAVPKPSLGKVRGYIWQTVSGRRYVRKAVLVPVVKCTGCPNFEWNICPCCSEAFLEDVLPWDHFSVSNSPRSAAQCCHPNYSQTGTQDDDDESRQTDRV
uniref:Uncharacterized protein n=1 Tax=Cacopsylla melanoneura TaxID=428564 RepID=A0A8D8W8J6_9HEMI